MSFIASIFGRNAPTTETVTAALARVEADLAAAPARLVKAEAALKDVAAMSDDEHAAAEAERDAARRSLARLEAQAEQLRKALSDAEKAEAAAALAARAKAAHSKLIAYGALVEKHDAQAQALAGTLSEMADVEREIASCNSAIDAARRDRLAAPEKVETPDQRFRSEPDVVTPETTVVEDRVQFFDGRHWIDVSVTQRFEGKLVLGAGEELRQVKRTIPGSTKYGRCICSPTTETVLAPARVGKSPFWPRSA